MNIEALKQQIVSTFKPFDPQQIIVFGSIARGDWDEMSDIDVIVVYRTNKSFLDRLKELYLSWDIPKAVDILAYTPEEFEQMFQQNVFIQEALNTGEVLYERN
ncbi:MAG TPA: nucleotidyltransferase domain-containing protein [Thermodesulfobacteriota bacterium]|nr:nucleotidyltransferase domain-containing protein [Thermodesulfobacteriota bacterium]